MTISCVLGHFKKIMRKNAMPPPFSPIGSSVKDPILLLPIESGCAVRMRTNKLHNCL